jgi:hypothetical protein
MAKIGLIGHSHAIVFLDAISVWRSRAGLDSAFTKGFGTSLQGWFADRPVAAFELEAKPEYAQFAGTKTILFPPKAPLALVTSRKTDSGAEIVLSELFQQCLRELSACDTIVSILYGSQVQEMSLYKSFSDYDFAPYDAPDVLPIDYQYIAAHLRSMAGMVMLPLKAMRHAMPSARIVHVAPPPPLEDPSKAAHTESTGADSIPRDALARPTLRMKWHDAYVQTLRRLVWQDGVQIVEPPREAVSDRGFLREEYADSIAHANESYGRLMADHVSQLLFGSAA